jgi:hypothetical protein
LSVCAKARPTSPPKATPPAAADIANMRRREMPRSISMVNPSLVRVAFLQILEVSMIGRRGMRDQ